MSRSNGIDVVDVALVAGLGVLLWAWFHKGAPGLSWGPNLLSAGQGGGGGTWTIKPEDLDREYNFRELLPTGKGEVGSMKLRDGARLVLAGRNNLGYGLEPADNEAAAAVQAYAAARIAGTLPA